MITASVIDFLGSGSALRFRTCGANCSGGRPQVVDRILYLAAGGDPQPRRGSSPESSLLPGGFAIIHWFLHRLQTSHGCPLA